MILICRSILKKELNPLKDYFSMEVVIESILKARKGLGEEIKGSPMKNSKLVKVYLTGKRGAGRVVHLLLVNKNHWIPLVLRLKKDKQVGENISIHNPAFKKLLEKNIDLVLEDLKNGDYKSLSLL